MKGIISWMKANLLVVICCFMILLFLPVGFFFSGRWNDAIKTKQTEAFSSEVRKLKGKERITYTLPSVLAGEEEISESRTPNAKVTEFYAAQRVKRDSQVASVLERGRDFNRREHTALVEGLFPEPANDRAGRTLLRQIAKRITGSEGERSVYRDLFADAGIGEPIDPEILGQRLNDADDREREKLLAEGSARTLSSEQEDELKNLLVGIRLNEYARRATEIETYGSPAVLFENTGASGGYSQIPDVYPDYQFDLTEAFIWNWDYWIVADLLDAINRANASTSGVPSVPDSVVKRIDSIRVHALPLAATGSSDSMPSRGMVRRPSGWTGCASGPDNQVYDIRLVEMDAVVSTTNLPRFIDALGQTNFMTVIDLDLIEVDVWADLKEGYYYGNEHVARASITIETVWLRRWTATQMPAGVRDGLGVVLPEAEESEEAPEGDGG